MLTSTWEGPACGGDTAGGRDSLEGAGIADGASSPARLSLSVRSSMRSMAACSGLGAPTCRSDSPAGSSTYRRLTAETRKTANATQPHRSRHRTTPMLDTGGKQQSGASQDCGEGMRNGLSGRAIEDKYLFTKRHARNVAHIKTRYQSQTVHSRGTGNGKRGCGSINPTIRPGDARDKGSVVCCTSMTRL